MSDQTLQMLRDLHHAWITATIKSEVLTTVSIRDAIDQPERLANAHRELQASTADVHNRFTALEKALKRELLAEPEDDQQLLDVPDFLRRHND